MFILPVIDLPRFWADFVIDRANIAPGRTGITFGLDGEDPERFSSDEDVDEEEPMPPEGDE